MNEMERSKRESLNVRMRHGDDCGMNEALEPQYDMQRIKRGRH